MSCFTSMLNDLIIPWIEKYQECNRGTLQGLEEDHNWSFQTIQKNILALPYCNEPKELGRLKKVAIYYYEYLGTSSNSSDSRCRDLMKLILLINKQFKIIKMDASVRSVEGGLKIYHADINLRQIRNVKMDLEEKKIKTDKKIETYSKEKFVLMSKFILLDDLYNRAKQHFFTLKNGIPADVETHLISEEKLKVEDLLSKSDMLNEMNMNQTTTLIKEIIDQQRDLQEKILFFSDKIKLEKSYAQLCFKNINYLNSLEEESKIKFENEIGEDVPEIQAFNLDF